MRVLAALAGVLVIVAVGLWVLAFMKIGTIDFVPLTFGWVALVAISLWLVWISRRRSPQVATDQGTGQTPAR
jgi:hypothetical protein